MRRPAHAGQQREVMMSDPHDREPVDQATIDCWRANYGLDKRTPAEAANWWSESMRGFAPSGCVAALGVALDELDALRKDAERYRRWRKDYTSARYEGDMKNVVNAMADALDADAVDGVIDAALSAAPAVGAA
jgi:hypothetical protein